ncbi:MAG: hypothetical protein A2908_02320 [Candidatus Staskawiczbacteria bacterium RIFCSPLOWO2_01_FULL_38_12b]|uniref:Uncharacterized protein n=1 Tax=Candidatus Staskawiczbacteria bacterium RIFCSPLOWO2_01_FULL_38_12b TaxID=1802214 RepID=A0A1G2ICK2_9BACT|nr:MAG: hypothetical protein A2908_02320 [Candidatus Staskawiczbacteria bacterium RIFCSPLOWO2_01_FULL_38_12b]
MGSIRVADQVAYCQGNGRYRHATCAPKRPKLVQTLEEQERTIQGGSKGKKPLKPGPKPDKDDEKIR